nr:hypothetical protein [Leptolyngbya sp. 7M]
MTVVSGAGRIQGEDRSGSSALTPWAASPGASERQTPQAHWPHQRPAMTRSHTARFAISTVPRAIEPADFSEALHDGREIA